MAESFIPLTTSNLSGSISSITSAIDSNFSSLKTLLNDVLSRSAASPNQMSGNLDMNGSNIINLPYPGTANSPIRLGDINPNSIGMTGPPGPAGPAGSANVASSINLTGSIVYQNEPSGPATGGGIWTNALGAVNASGKSTDATGQATLSQLHFTENVDASSSGILKGLYVNVDSINAGIKGGRSTLTTRYTLRTQPADTAGQYGSFNAYTTALVNVGGTAGIGNGKGSIFGGNTYSLLGNGATFWSQNVGFEIDVSVQSGASTDECIGLQIVQQADFTSVPNRTSSIAFSANNDLVQGSISGWDYLLCDGAYAGWPSMKTTGTLLGCYLHANSGAKPTIANAIDLNNYASITGYILRGPGSNGFIDGNFNINANTLTVSGIQLQLAALYSSGSSFGPVTAGTGYAAGDIITLTGGTFTYAAQISVVTVDVNGAVLTYALCNPGRYTIVPANPVLQGSTNGTGSGATFNINWGPVASSLDCQGLTSGNGNFFIGGAPSVQTLFELAGGYCSGPENTFVGFEAGARVTTGQFNTGIGCGAIGNGGNSNVTCSNNIAIGTDSFRNVISGGNNVGIGVSTFRNPAATNFNVAIGTQAMQGQASTTAASNVAIGYSAMQGTSMTTAGNNVAIGGNSTLNITSGLNGVYVGFNTGQGITTGGNNVIIGSVAGQHTTGSGNTVVGFQALTSATSGNSNTVIGASVGSTTLATGARNILIGTSSNTDTLTSSTSDTLVIGCSSGTTPWLTGSLLAASPTHVFAGNITAGQSFSITAGGTAGQGFMFGGATNFGIFYGSGAPTLSAAQGSIYLRTDGSSTSTRLYVNTNGATTWTNVTTAA